MHPLVLIGGGGHCRVVLDALRRLQTFRVIGVLDSQLPRGTMVDEVAVIGTDEDLERVRQEGVCHAFIAVGSLGSVAGRQRIAQHLDALEFEVPSLVHPSVIVGRGVQLERGVLVAAGVVLQADVTVGAHAIINTASSLDHDCRIGAFVHVAPGVVMSGGVHVGEGAHIGTGCAIIGSIAIGEGCVIGVGSAVVTDIPPHCVAFGNPCRVQQTERV